jgi:catechol 2,3-dioxygenase-like lactoylglutathione lyase family enzyme
MFPPPLAIPILPARDLDATSAFYARLRFRELGRWPDYLIVGRDGLELHFFACPEIDPETSIAGCYLRVEDADALHAEFAAAGLPPWESGFPCLSKVEVTDYGMREFAAGDPDGNLLRVGSRRPPPRRPSRPRAT